MSFLQFRLSVEQRTALNTALEASRLSEQEFVERAIRMLATRFGVEYPESATVIQPFPQPKPRNPGGRPRKPVNHPMGNDVPAGDFPRVCPNCGRNFRSDSDKAVYCSHTCKIQFENRKMYLKRKKR